MREQTHRLRETECTSGINIDEVALMCAKYKKKSIIPFKQLIFLFGERIHVEGRGRTKSNI